MVIVPLLSLTANQMARIRGALQEYCTSEAHHLDDLPPAVVKEKVVRRMDEFDAQSSSVIFCLCSPQYITNNKSFLEALLRAHERKVLRLVAIDKAHLYAAHGRSFREEIRVLKHVFFSNIYGVLGYHPLFYGDCDNDVISSPRAEGSHLRSLESQLPPDVVLRWGIPSALYKDALRGNFRHWAEGAATHGRSP